MEVLVLQIFVSLMLVIGSIVLFSYSAKHKDHQHAARLALLPLEDESTQLPTKAKHESGAPTQ